MGFAANTLAESSDQARLADSRLARKQYDLSLAIPRKTLALEQKRHLTLAVDDIGAACFADRPEAAFPCRDALHRPPRDSVREAPELVPPEVTKMKQIAKQPARGGRENDRSGLSQSLQAARNVGCLPDHGMLMQRAIAGEIADHQQAGGNADAYRQRFSGRCLKLRNRRNDVETGLNRSLRVAEVMHDRVAVVDLEVALLDD